MFHIKSSLISFIAMLAVFAVYMIIPPLHSIDENYVFTLAIILIIISFVLD